MVPCQRGDTFAGLDAKRSQGMAEPVRARRHVAIGIAVQRAVSAPADDRSITEDRRGAPEDCRDRELIVVDETVHRESRVTSDRAAAMILCSPSRRV